MKKSNTFFILIGVYFWITAQNFILRFFSFEDFLKKYVLGFIGFLWAISFLFIFLIGFVIYFVRSAGKLNEFVKILYSTKEKIDESFQKRIQAAFWFPLPKDYHIGTKNLKNTYTTLWASVGFLVYFFLNSTFNTFSSGGLFSFKFLLTLLFSIISVYFFVGFSFVTLLAFSSYVLEKTIELAEFKIFYNIRFKINEFFINNYRVLSNYIFFPIF